MQKLSHLVPEKNITWQRGTLFLPASHTTWNIGSIKNDSNITLVKMGWDLLGVFADQDGDGAWHALPGK